MPYRTERDQALEPDGIRHIYTLLDQESWQRGAVGQTLSGQILRIKIYCSELADNTQPARAKAQDCLEVPLQAQPGLGHRPVFDTVLTLHENYFQDRINLVLLLLTAPLNGQPRFIVSLQCGAQSLGISTMAPQ